MAFGRANIPKLANVIALGAQITAQPDSIEATEVEGVVQSTEAALRVLLEELARQEARAVAPATPALREALGLLRRARMAAAQAPSTPTPNTPLPNTPRDSLCGSGSSMGSSRGCQSSSSAVSWASSLVEEA